MKAKKKKRQDDFQKVKLKVGKKKPKADNATNTSFRSKGIHLPDQLKRDASGPTTHRHLGINDLLSQLHHYNANVKHSALLGLRELLSLNPQLLDSHLSRLLSEVAAVFTDKDANVRMAATRVLRYIAQSVPADRVAPFFPLLSAHLSCAMTHIEVSIQEDAMKVLDVLLEHYPALLASRPAVLLTNFLELISHRQNSGGAKKAQDSKTRTWALSVNPGRTVTSQQWRLNVLLRLGQFLQAVVDERPVEKTDMSQSEGAVDSSKKGHITSLNLTWEELIYSKVAVNLFEHSGAKPTWFSTFKLRPQSDSTSEIGESLDSKEAVQNFASTLVPLLLEVWVEASVNNNNSWNSSDAAHLLTPDAMSVMFQVLSILQLLRKLAPHQEHQEALDAWFRKEYLGDFKQHFLKNFPYGNLDTPKHKKKNDSIKRNKQAAVLPVTTVDPLALNITLCQVMVSLSQKQEPTTESDSGWLTPLRIFVQDTLSSGVKLSSKQLNMLLDTVWKMVLTQKSRAVTEDLLAAIYSYYQQKHLTLQTRSLLLSFYGKLYQQEQVHSNIARSKVLSHWLASLPVQLSQLGHRNPTLSALLIRSIQAAASRGNKDMLNSLQKYAPELYDPNEGVIVFLPSELQHQMVQLLYFLPKMPQSLLANLSGCCNHGRISASMGASLIRIVHLRSSVSGWTAGSQEPALQDVDYLSFLFSSLTGFSSEKLSMLQDTAEECVLPLRTLSPLSLHPTPAEHFKHHWDIVDEVCLCLENLGSKSQCFDVVQNGMLRYLAKLRVIPDSTAAALLKAMTRLRDRSVVPSEPVLRLLSLCCLSLLALLTTLQQETPETNQKREAIWGACVSALSGVPRLLRMVLQLLRVGDLSEEELPHLGQVLSMLLQHAPLHNQLLANTALLQDIIQQLTRYSRGGTREQWMTDLLYCYSVTMAHSSTVHRGSVGMRDMY
ncbi:testis-expressed protein 10 homolog [Boleophthalmus pectinirostris]|uniref:testis-expressed protein 10 homolog n=1 Tax=Boleophthalmus pectinirostris TaxID=150288 RepID=UPI000A1C4600|nr:testis-expressed protein 10 homolog [Boleophthalmus pectinirostris]XP_020792929.1 testis-expressed protein 10 homolog [Boleophthalmus pectinirostris]XP_055019673.1 testis-expressed protein 10 homolog [Boleophthalmus pectinirostris]XP_055019674.1 testis-expressed protein 10 homolog [Boleophthalmus pectinirostris]